MFYAKIVRFAVDEAKLAESIGLSIRSIGEYYREDPPIW